MLVGAAAEVSDISTAVLSSRSMGALPGSWWIRSDSSGWDTCSCSVWDVMASCSSCLSAGSWLAAAEVAGSCCEGDKWRGLLPWLTGRNCGEGAMLRWAATLDTVLAGTGKTGGKCFAASWAVGGTGAPFVIAVSAHSQRQII